MECGSGKLGHLSRRIFGSRLMPTVYLHIGLGKSGSTSIQHVLRRERDAFLRAGKRAVALPQDVPVQTRLLMSPYAYARLAVEGEAILRRRDLIAPLTAGDEAQLTAEICHALRTDPDEDLVVSSEFFLDNLPDRNWARLNILARIVSRIAAGRDLKVRAYCRPQDQYIESLYYQMFYPRFETDFNDYLAAFPPFANENQSFDIDYLSIRHAVERALPNAIVEFRNIQLMRAVGQTLIGDFLSWVGMPLSFMTQDLRVNPGLSRQGIELFRIAARSGTFDRTLLDFIVARRGLRKSGDLPYGFLSSEQWSRIFEHYLDSNAKVFGVSSDLYRTAVGTCPPTTPTVNMRDEDVVSMLTSERQTSAYIMYRMKRGLRSILRRAVRS